MTAGKKNDDEPHRFASSTFVFDPEMLRRQLAEVPAEPSPPPEPLAAPTTAPAETPNTSADCSVAPVVAPARPALAESTLILSNNDTDRLHAAPTVPFAAREDTPPISAVPFVWEERAGSASAPPMPLPSVVWLGPQARVDPAKGKTFGAHFLAAMDRESLAQRDGSTHARLVFSPFELEILEEHAEQAAFLWSMRANAASDPRYDRKGLARLDERLEARLDALRLAEDAGWEAAWAQLDFPDAGVLFVAAVLAIDRFDTADMARVLDTLERKPICMDGVLGALNWVSFELVARVLPGLLSPGGPPELHYLGLASCAFHRRDLGPLLANVTGSSDARLRARALMAAGELGRVDLRPMVRDALADPDDGCRFAAGFAGVLLGEPAAVRVLTGLAEAGGPFAARACAMAVRRMPVGAARAWLFGLAEPRTALFGAAALGDMEMVPWIVERMNDRALARLAASSMAMITGADFFAEKLEGKAPEGFVSGPTDDPDDEDVAMDPDENLPWPDVAAVTKWWGGKGHGFAKDRRYLMGRPVEAEWLEELLRMGYQHVRAAAAVELCVAGRRKVLAEVRGREGAAAGGRANVVGRDEAMGGVT